MILVLGIILGIIGFILMLIGEANCSDIESGLGAVLILLTIGLFIFRMFSWICKLSKDRRNTSRCCDCC